MSRYHYRVYGLNLDSELELPELTPARKDSVGVLVAYGEVPEHLPEVNGSGILFEATKDDFLFRFEGVGRFRVQNGKQITIQPDWETFPEDVRLILLGSCMGALLQQRGMLALHGSAVTDSRQTVIISGSSGVGKSTLASGMLMLGHSVIADDISVICPRGEGLFGIAPGIPHLKLWKDVLMHLNQDSELAKVRPQVEKFRKPISLPENETPTLSKVVLINPVSSTNYSYSEILGREKFHLLRSNTYRWQFIDKMARTEAHFHMLSQVVNSIRMFQVNRPHKPLNIMKFAEYVSDIVFDSDA